jgi:hypothetical protein
MILNITLPIPEYFVIANCIGVGKMNIAKDGNEIQKSEPPFFAQPKDVAPVFSAEAYNNMEKRIRTIGLEDYRGTWIVLFFYPSNFTYV